MSRARRTSSASTRIISYLILNVKSGRPQWTIAFIRDVFQRLNPEYPFEIHSLDEAIDRDEAIREQRKPGKDGFFSKM